MQHGVYLLGPRGVEPCRMTGCGWGVGPFYHPILSTSTWSSVSLPPYELGCWTRIVHSRDSLLHSWPASHKKLRSTRIMKKTFFSVDTPAGPILVVWLCEGFLFLAARPAPVAVLFHLSTPCVLWHFLYLCVTGSLAVFGVIAGYVSFVYTS